MALYARPTRLEHEISHKIKCLLEGYCRNNNINSVKGFCITRQSHIYSYLLGAMEALQLLSGRGIEEKENMFRELDKITGMVIENSQVIIEEK